MAAGIELAFGLLSLASGSLVGVQNVVAAVFCSLHAQRTRSIWLVMEWRGVVKETNRLMCAGEIERERER